VILFWVVDCIAELPQDPNIGLLQSQKYQLDLLQPSVVGLELSNAAVAAGGAPAHITVHFK
jgi:hypothetical protein